jgi:hypothetical protein
MFVKPSIWCHDQPFFTNYDFAQFFGSMFPICLTILHTPIPTVFFPSFSTWKSHNHFIGIKYTTRGPIGQNVVCSSSFLHSSPYNNNPSYLCFPFLGEWYTYRRSYIKCDPCVFMILVGVFNIMVFSVSNEMCSLVSTKVGPFYITSY